MPELDILFRQVPEGFEFLAVLFTILGSLGIMVLLGTWFFITNSMVVTWFVALALILFARYATRKMQEIPTGAQNFWEWLVESLYEFLEGIIGSELVKKSFWFFATIFIFILFVNWFGLIPGVGTIG